MLASSHRSAGYPHPISWYAFSGESANRVFVIGSNPVMPMVICDVLRAWFAGLCQNSFRFWHF
jgi:hypothetical protein